jgi:hypothetical protein
VAETWCWTCGHEAGAVCAECHAVLVRKCNLFVEIIDRLLDACDDIEVAEQARKDLTQALHGPISTVVKSPSKDSR